MEPLKESNPLSSPSRREVAGGFPAELAHADWCDIIEDRGRRLKDKVYIESLDQGKRITFGEMNECCNRMASFLRQRQIRSDDRITLIGKNTIETLAIYFGVLKYGAIINPIFFEESEENLFRIVSMVKPRLVFYDSDLQLNVNRYAEAQWLRFSAYDAKGIKDKEKGAKADDFFRSLNEYSPIFEGCITHKKDVGVILYTSGTTEVPKGIQISREALFYMVDEISDRTGMTEEDKILEYRAYNWASVQLLTVLSAMLKGATLFLAKRFSRSKFPLWLRKHGITISSGVPAVINMLINEPVPLSRDDVPNLRFITSSSAPLSVESHLRFEEIYGIPINQMMGMTEAGWMAGNPPAKRKMGSVGPPLKHKEIYFLTEKGDVCRLGEVGEMIVRGKAMGLCYSKEDGTIERFSEEGFATGDLGYMDEDGYIYITGRKKDLIIRGGINISPLEITSRILEHPAICEAATIGVPDKIYGEEVVCFVVVKEGHAVRDEEIIKHCALTLPFFKTPKQAFIVPEIPKTQRGKISKTEMVRLYEARAQKASQPDAHGQIKSKAGHK